MDLTLNPTESGQLIAMTSTDVTINDEKCKELAKMMMSALRDGSISSIDYNANPLHPKNVSQDIALNWVLLLDAINFSFWPDEGTHYDVTYKGKQYTGYLACCAALMKAFDAEVPIASAQWMRNVKIDELDRILQSDSGHSIPLLKERVDVIHEIGNKLYLTLIRLILNHFESFRDDATYQGRKVSLLKRAQILAADTWGLLKGKTDIADFEDIDTLTMFADYRVPQALYFLGALSYSQNLQKRLWSKELIPNGDHYEVQIRGCSIAACARVAAMMQDMRLNDWDNTNWYRLRQLNAIDVDVFLWQYRRDHADEVEKCIPFHRTRSIYY